MCAALFFHAVGSPIHSFVTTCIFRCNVNAVLVMNSSIVYATAHARRKVRPVTRVQMCTENYAKYASRRVSREAVCDKFQVRAVAPGQSARPEVPLVSRSATST